MAQRIVCKISETNGAEDIYKLQKATFNVTPAAIEGDSLRLKITFDKGSSLGAEGWLDWIEVNYEQNASMNGHELLYFSLTEGIDSGKVAGLSIAGLDNSYRLWDISETANPVAILPQNGQFSVSADNIRRFVAFKGGFKTLLQRKKLSHKIYMGCLSRLFDDCKSFVFDRSRKIGGVSSQYLESQRSHCYACTNLQ